MTDVEWRWMRGWSKNEVSALLERAATLPLNFEETEEQMTLDRGWSQVESQAVIARDRPGPPSGDDAFDRLKHAVIHYGFSDPRIVHAHFDASTPLEGRPVLLELKSVGPHYLCPVRIGAVRDEDTEGRTVFGFRLDTLWGHIEAGREWFLLSKDHGSGELRFHIKAAWREGHFPNWWSYVGFELMGRRYQRAWHHLSHARLRGLMRTGHLERHPEAEELSHVEVGLKSVRFYSQKALGRRLSGTEREVERVRRDKLLTTVGFGVLAGMRTFSAPALLSHQLSREPVEAPKGRAHALASRRTSRVLAVLAAGELVGDKLPWTPARISPPSLVARALSGALAGAAVAAPHQRLSAGRALLGAAAAVASSFAFYKLRQLATRRLGLPNVVAGLMEDALVVTLGGRLLAAMR
ncbi:DUF1990 family protein [Archangium violaceum]|uniref:DUF1990 family protein n=1 Tax=Archangium violaceum TaxID=83451 RepID=UPI00193AE924|nr:DUF1990 family protein [Archangium violaceum]QRK05056.1 DUF1990 family protein [Archangium violaceum]